MPQVTIEREQALSLIAVTSDYLGGVAAPLSLEENPESLRECELAASLIGFLTQEYQRTLTAKICFSVTNESLEFIKAVADPELRHQRLGSVLSRCSPAPR